MNEQGALQNAIPGDPSESLGVRGALQNALQGDPSESLGVGASLSNLRGIVEPEPPPLWPPAPGVWVVLIIAVAMLLALVLWWQRARARSAYRRAGLALLAGARTARDIDVILKRVALAVFPRPTVAPLYGEEWAAFLEGTCSQARFAALVEADPSAEASPELRQVAGTWIRHHHVTKGGP